MRLPVTNRRKVGVSSSFFFQAEDGIRGIGVTGVQTCALPISPATLGLINLRVAGAQLPTDVRKQMWSAQWITSPEGPQRDQSVLHFRKFIELAQQQIGRASCRERA